MSEYDTYEEMQQRAVEICGILWEMRTRMKQIAGPYDKKTLATEDLWNNACATFEDMGLTDMIGNPTD